MIHPIANPIGTYGGSCSQSYSKPCSRSHNKSYSESYRNPYSQCCASFFLKVGSSTEQDLWIWTGSAASFFIKVCWAPALGSLAPSLNSYRIPFVFTLKDPEGFSGASRRILYRISFVCYPKGDLCRPAGRRPASHRRRDPAISFHKVGWFC